MPFAVLVISSGGSRKSSRWSIVKFRGFISDFTCGFSVWAAFVDTLNPFLFVSLEKQTVIVYCQLLSNAQYYTAACSLHPMLSTRIITVVFTRSLYVALFSLLSIKLSHTHTISLCTHFWANLSLHSLFMLTGKYIRLWMCGFFFCFCFCFTGAECTWDVLRTECVWNILGGVCSVCGMFETLRECMQYGWVYV